jgi:hypothetical protein
MKAFWLLFIILLIQSSNYSIRALVITLELTFSKQICLVAGSMRPSRLQIGSPLGWICVWGFPHRRGCSNGVFVAVERTYTPCLGLYLRLRPCGCSSMVVLPPLSPVEASSLGLNASSTARYRLHLCLKIGAIPPSTTDCQIHINSAAVSGGCFIFVSSTWEVT